MEHIRRVAIVWGIAIVVALAIPVRFTALPQTKLSKTEFLKFPAGTFQMGCLPEAECDEDEKPLHEVRITQDFELSRHEVTRELWIAVMGTKPCIYEDKDLTEPVGCVSWNDTQKFIKKVNDKNDGYRYRLPTEAEWEHAAKRDTNYTLSRDVSAEWMQDWYARYEGGPETDPRGPATGSVKAMRGWIPNLSTRAHAVAGLRHSRVGFRLLRQPVKGG